MHLATIAIGVCTDLHDLLIFGHVVSILGAYTLRVLLFDLPICFTDFLVNLEDSLLALFFRLLRLLCLGCLTGPLHPLY